MIENDCLKKYVPESRGEIIKEDGESKCKVLKKNFFLQRKKIRILVLRFLVGL